MAKDGFDVVTDVRSLINISPILGLLDGGKVEPSVKSTRSSVKGVVVNALGITNAQDQVSIGNVNCYAPPVISNINGKEVQLPDQQVLNTLVKAISPLIDDIYTSTFRVWITEMGTIMQDTDGSYFANIGFRYQSIK